MSSDDKYTAVLGMGAPFENAGIVDSWGVEVGANYTARLGSVIVNAGGNFNWNRNEIKEQLEEPRQYPNLVQTGHSLNQLYGLVADGLFEGRGRSGTATADAAPELQHALRWRREV